jgi:hypothetical protein
LRFNDLMRGGFVTVLLVITALAAYSVGRQDAPANQQPVAPVAIVRSTAKPVALTTPVVEQAKPPPQPTAVPDVSEKKPESKRKVEAVLTAAAIAAIIIQISRDQYHAGGRPCACPDDRARNGSACGGRSAYSRPGGAAPLCYPHDVTAAMIDAYRQKQPSH